MGEIPHRHVVARVAFNEVDQKETDRLREEARQQATAVYDQNPAPLVEFKARVLNELTQLAAAKRFADVNMELWVQYDLELAGELPEPTAEERQKQFEEFQKALTAEGAEAKVRQTIEDLFAPLIQNGIMELPN